MATDRNFEKIYGYAREELKSKALEMVNRIINDLKPGEGVKRLQPGIKGNSRQCTLAKSFAVAGFRPMVDGSQIILTDEEGHEHFFDCDQEGGTLIDAFDSGDLPELEKGNPESRLT